MGAKPTWPVALAISFTLIFAPAASACTGADTPPSKLSVQAASDAVICLMNEQRANQGLGELGANAELAGAAQGHSGAMNRRNFFAHGNFQGRIRRSGYPAGASAWTVGENLYWGRAGRGTPAAAVAGWMNSAPHRDAILSGRYHDAGVGVAIGSPIGRRGRNTAIYTVDFGGRG